MSLIYPTKGLVDYPKHLSPGYKSTIKRSPSKPLIVVPHTLSELTGPVYGHNAIEEGDNDLTKMHKGEPLGERIIVHGQILDEDKRPVPEVLVELWQANACGRYVHIVDQHPAPLDPNLPARAARSPTRTATTSSLPSSRAPIRGATTTMRGGRTTSTSRCSVTRSCRGW
jgi:protocatechuate 3,4-dioxygenase beta subunit